MFPSRASNPNSEACVTMVCEVLPVHIFSVIKVIEWLFAGHCYPTLTMGSGSGCCKAVPWLAVTLNIQSFYLT